MSGGKPITHPPSTEIMWITPGSIGVTSPLLQVPSCPSTGLNVSGPEGDVLWPWPFPVTTASLLEQGASSADTGTLSGATTKASYSNWLFAGAHVDPCGLCVEYVPDQLDDECVPLSQFSPQFPHVRLG